MSFWKPRNSPCPPQGVHSIVGKKGVSSNVPERGHVSDMSQQVWILQGDILVAVPRKADVASVTVTVLPCKFPESLEQDKGIPIYLGIQQPEMCLSCEDIEGQPTLKLKAEKILDLYNQPGPVKPFLFYHRKTGRTSTFESVAFPGWFIATCTEGGSPLIITQEPGKVYTTDFGII
ncbi:interleukin-36 alpha-like [Talpa occidentalis]|uniref:interleukin-36 alpha-like n=1 Tax=Talpa occidentalis TaxID=50954 RepID=UPI00188F7349|nr:interleukin-36 alpha-like [Talpa occidentalis]